MKSQATATTTTVTTHRVVLCGMFLLAMAHMWFGVVEAAGCALTNPDLINLQPKADTNIGLQCPMGSVKITHNKTSTCVNLQSFLNETVGKKACVWKDPGSIDTPAMDAENCQLSYLFCSNQTGMCEMMATRALGDACVDRFSCYGPSKGFTLVNCYQNTCQLLKPAMILPLGSTCPMVTDGYQAVLYNFLNYSSNSYAECQSDLICQLMCSATSCNNICIRKVTQLNGVNEICGKTQISITLPNGTETTEVQYQDCEDGLRCNNNAVTGSYCNKMYTVPDGDFATYRFPFFGCKTGAALAPTSLMERKVCSSSAFTQCSTTNDCSGFDAEVPTLAPYTTQYFTVRRCYAKKCRRLFGGQVGDTCAYNMDCYSGYCNMGTCGVLPGNLTCGTTVSCPNYAYCSCAAGLGSGTCINYCFGELTDFYTCMYNHGWYGLSIYSNQQLILDEQSSIFSLQSGACKQYYKKYLTCAYQSQSNSSLTTVPLSIDTTTTLNTSLVIPSDSQYGAAWSLTSDTYTLDTKLPLPPAYDYDLTLVDMINESLNTTLQDIYIARNNQTIQFFENIVMHVAEHMAALIPKYRPMPTTNIRLCTCCSSKVTDYVLRVKQEVGIYTYNYRNNTELFITRDRVGSVTNSITTYEPVDGHDSFLNRNWYDSCDVIIVEPSQIDEITLAIKNNMLLLAGNETVPYTVEELSEMNTQDLFTVRILLLASKVYTIPRNVRDQLFTNETFSNGFMKLYNETIVSRWAYLNEIIATNGSSSLNDSSISAVKAYNELLFSVPIYSNQEFASYPVLAPVETDYFFYDKLQVTVNESYFNLLPNTSLYSFYNTYLGIFHYRDSSKYWDIILKDSMLWFVVATAMIHTVAVSIGYFKVMALKRRLFLPFVAPFSFLIICIIHTEPCLMGIFKSVGKNIYAFIPIPNLFMSLFSATYIVILGRFYYLRNLYHLTRETKSMKLYRITAQPFVAFLLVMVVTALIFSIWFGIYYRIMDSIVIRGSSFEWSLIFDAVLISITTQVAFVSLVTLSVLIIDAILNMRLIREKGLLYYLFFDDPFRMRVDMISLLIMVLSSALVMLDVFVWQTLIVNRLASAVFFTMGFMISGGNILLDQFFVMMRKIPENRACETPTNDNEMELHWLKCMEDPEYKSFHKQYAKNELSEENLLIVGYLKFVIVIRSLRICTHWKRRAW